MAFCGKLARPLGSGIVALACQQSLLLGQADLAQQVFASEELVQGS